MDSIIIFAWLILRVCAGLLQIVNLPVPAQFLKFYMGGIFALLTRDIKHT